MAALISRREIGPNRDTFEKLRAAYAERHRHYHSVEHIAHCLAELDAVRELAREPDEVELALWFHDAVYVTRSKNNEAKSAEWAARFLTDNAVDAGRIRRVHDFIMATTHKAAPRDWERVGKTQPHRGDHSYELSSVTLTGSRDEPRPSASSPNRGGQSPLS